MLRGGVLPCGFKLITGGLSLELTRITVSFNMLDGINSMVGGFEVDRLTVP